jgi:hypothetical protein
VARQTPARAHSAEHGRRSAHQGRRSARHSAGRPGAHALTLGVEECSGAGAVVRPGHGWLRSGGSARPDLPWPGYARQAGQRAPASVVAPDAGAGEAPAGARDSRSARARYSRLRGRSARLPPEQQTPTKARSRRSARPDSTLDAATKRALGVARQRARRGSSTRARRDRHEEQRLRSGDSTKRAVAWRLWPGRARPPRLGEVRGPGGGRWEASGWRRLAGWGG